MLNLPDWMCGLPMQLLIILAAGGLLGLVVRRFAVWWGCRHGRRRLREIEQDLAVEVRTNGTHVRSITTMLNNSPRDSGVFKSLDE